MTQEQVAERLGIPRSAVSDIEAGKRELSAAEVVALGNLFGESIESLLGVVEPSTGGEEMMFRAESSAPVVRAQLEAWVHLCDVYAAIEQTLAEGRTAELRPVTGLFSSFEQAARLADEERARLDLGPTPAHVLLAVLEDRLGVKVFYLELEDSISGASMMSARFGPAILVNRRHTPGRRAFTLAHELFHLIVRGSVLRGGRQPLWHVCDGGTQHQKKDRVEQLADRFAGRLLMPPNQFIERLRLMTRDDGSIDQADLIGVARYFGVSVQAVFVQLGLLDLAPRELTMQAYRDPAFQEDLARVGGDTGPTPQRFARLAIKAHRAEHISRGRLAELLEIDAGDVDDVLRRYGAGGPDGGIAVALPC
jgi:XRE family transcriptional regulator, fatty acid utilization regulator